MHSTNMIGASKSRCWGDIRLLQDLLDFGIVGLFDLIVVKEFLLGGDMGIDLEALFVDTVCFLVPPDVMDQYIVGFGRPVVCFWPIRVCWCWRRTIFIIFVKVENGSDILCAVVRGI